MRFTQIKIISMFSIYLFAFYIISCNFLNQNKEKGIEGILIRNVVLLDSTIAFDIENKGIDTYYMVYSYRGELDQRLFPLIEVSNGSNLKISYEPFISEIIDKYTDSQKDKDPPLSTNDEIGLLRIEKNFKGNIVLQLGKNTKLNKGILKLFFSKYNKDDLTNEKIVYIPPTTEMLSIFEFKELVINF